jgi:hypothetical protein
VARTSEEEPRRSDRWKYSLLACDDPVSYCRKTAFVGSSPLLVEIRVDCWCQISALFPTGGSRRKEEGVRGGHCGFWRCCRNHTGTGITLIDPP